MISYHLIKSTYRMWSTGRRRSCRELCVGKAGGEEGQREVIYLIPRGIVVLEATGYTSSRMSEYHPEQRRMRLHLYLYSTRSNSKCDAELGKRAPWRDRLPDLSSAVLCRGETCAHDKLSRDARTLPVRVQQDK